MTATVVVPIPRKTRRRFQWLACCVAYSAVALWFSRWFPDSLRSFSVGRLATTKIYVVRHGSVIPPGGKKGAIYGGAEVELSEKGKEEAQAAAEYLLEEAPHFDAVYASGLSRAIYGAEKVCEGRDGLHVIQDLRFNEIGRGVWVGLTKEEIAERYPDHMEAIGSLSSFEKDPEFSGHGGESYRAVGRRVLAGRDSLLAKYPDSKICLVCHNWVAAAFVGDATGVPPEEWCTLKIPTASVSLVEIIHQTNEDDDSIVIKSQKVLYAGKSPAEYTGGRLEENVGSAFFSGKG